MSLVRGLRDLATIKRLLTLAETEARGVGDERPGPADLLLAALALPDGTAARVFRSFGLEQAAVRTAIAAARAEVGGSSAVAADGATKAQPNAKPRAYRSTPEAQAVFQSAVALTKETKPRSRLLGAHVVAASCDLDHGVVAHALRHLAIDPTTLRATAYAEARDAG